MKNPSVRIVSFFKSSAKLVFMTVSILLGLGLSLFLTLILTGNSEPEPEPQIILTDLYPAPPRSDINNDNLIWIDSSIPDEARITNNTDLSVAVGEVRCDKEETLYGTRPKQGQYCLIALNVRTLIVEDVLFYADQQSLYGVAVNPVNPDGYRGSFFLENESQRSPVIKITPDQPRQLTLVVATEKNFKPLAFLLNQ